MPPLAGTTVADLTRYLPGPFASRELQRLGARVVKIEPPEGDPSRTASPGWYRALNEGKRVIAWDARSEPPPPELLAGGRRARGIPAGRLGAARGRAAADARSSARSPASAPTGPHAAQAGHDLNYLGYAGALADTAPALPPVQIADLAAGAQGAVIEILAALLARAQSGQGCRLSISMTHGSHQFVAHRLAGDPVERLLTGGVACYRIYETADGRHLTVAALEPKFWQRLCELIGRPDLAARAFEPELPELEALFRTRTMREWLDLLEHEDTCVGPVLSLTESAAELA